MVIERPILKILNNNPEEPVRIFTYGEKIMVQNDSEAAAEEFDLKLAAFLEDIDGRYGIVLQHLA